MKKNNKSKEPTDLLSGNLDHIVVSDKFKHNNEVFYWLPKKWNCYTIMHYLTSNEWVYKVF